MFNTNKAEKRRLSILLALMMVLSLCSGFGFVRTETVWAADDVVTEGEDADVASGDPIEPVVAYPIRLATADGTLELWAYDSEGNKLEEAEAGTEVTVEVNMECELMQQYKFMGFMVWAMLEDGTADMETVILNTFDMENAETVATFEMPAHGVVVGVSYGPYWQELSVYGGTVTKIDGETLEDLEFVFEGQMIANAEITIEADEIEGFVFIGWKVLSENVDLENPISPVTTFVMPKEDVQIEAVYRSEYLPIYFPSDETIDIWAEDSEGNRITEAKVGEEIIVKINPECDFFQLNILKHMGFIVWGAYEDSTPNYDEEILNIFDQKNAPTTCTFVMPECEYGVRVGTWYGGYWSNLSISNGKLTKIDGETLEDLEFVFEGQMAATAEVTIEADDIADAIFVKWASNNDEVKFANPYARTTTFVMPKSDVKVYALYDYIEVSTPTPTPSAPEQDDSEDVTPTQPDSKPDADKDSEDAKDDSSKPGTTPKPEEEKNPDVITEKDVYTKVEQEKLAEFKLPEVVAELQEKVEEFVQEIINVFNKVSEEVQEQLKENITFEKVPASEKALATELNNNPVDLMSKSLSLKEQKRIEAGEKLNMYMEVKDKTETVSKQEKNLVEKTMQDISVILNEGKAEGSERKTELGMYLDLNLMKQIGNDEAKKVDRPKGKIDVSIQVPENLLNKDANVQRVYQIICVYDGKSVLLDTEFNVKTNTLSFKTNKFTTFALIYTDVPVEK